MIPSSLFGTNSIRWNSEEDLFSVQYENTIVKDILDYIEKHSKYIFIYSANVQKNLNNKVSISVSNKKIDAVLKELFSETGLNYKMSEGKLRFRSQKLLKCSKLHSKRVLR